MADNNITYKIFVDTDSGTATIRDLKGQITQTQVPVDKLSNEFTKLTASTKANTNASNGNIVAHRNSEIAIQNEITKLSTLKSALDVSSTGYESMGNKISLLKQKLKTVQSGSTEFSKTLVQQKNASGAATSSVLELGRVVQDAPYGIRGMANNITQLASQIAFTTKTAGGFGKALKEIGKAFLGPMGVIFLVSVAVSLLETFSTKIDKTEKRLRKLAESGITNAVTELTTLKSVLEDTTISLDKKQEALKKAREEYDELNVSIDQTPESIIDAVKAIDLLTTKYQDFAKAKALTDLLTESLKEQAKQNIKTEGSFSDLFKSFGSFTTGMTALYQGGNPFDTALAIDKTKITKDLEAIDELFKKPTDADPSISYYELIFGKKGGGSGKDKKWKGKKASIFDLSGVDISDKAHKEYIDKLSSMFGFGDELNASINRQFEKDLRGLELSKKIGEITKEEYDDAILKLRAKLSEDRVITGVAPILDFELNEKTKEGIRAYNQSVLDEFNRISDLEDFQNYAEKFQNVMGEVSNFVDGEAERQLTIEQNKTNALNEELNQRLLNEQLSVDERKNIQNQIWQNDEKLRKKQNEIKKKQFDNQKAFNIANAVIDTGRAAAGVLADTKGNVTARIAGMIAVVGAGLAQVATIARQKFQPDGATTPIRTGAGGGSAGGGGDREFNFNLVGNSVENQIASAIQGQFDKPLKAFVVSKDITTQQELDANIKGSATL